MSKLTVLDTVQLMGSMFKEFVTALAGSLMQLLLLLEVAMIAELMKNLTCLHWWMPCPLELMSLVTTPIQFQRNC